MADVPSRLSSGNIYYNGSYIPIEKYRNLIFARSLYNLDSEYKNTQLFSENGQANLASSVSTVLNVIPQYNRMQVNTNLLGNIYDSFRDDGSPLAKIGLTMLGKQMAYNSAMNLSVKYLPSVDLSQILKGNPKKIFTINRNNTITVKNSDDKTFGDKVSGFASNFLGVDTYDVFGNANPFTNPDMENNIGYIENTGEMQLKRFYSAINLNIYKPFIGTNDPYTNILLEYKDEIGVKLDLNSVSILSKQPTFTFDNNTFHKYLGIKINPTAINRANSAMDISYSGNTDSVLEYAPTRKYVLDNFGSTVKAEDKTITDWVGDESNLTTDNSFDKIVWGRDGLSPESLDYISEFRGSDDQINDDNYNDLNTEKFNVKKGLLEYTRNLLNSTNGQFIDQTRKAFKKDNTIVGFNGSPLWTTNNKKYSVDSGNEIGKTGIREHSPIDPYDRFAKSIRFKGNVVYNGESNGNQDSVIYKTVLPRIHPTRDEEGGINNKNLMFSIENLAVGTIKRDKYGVIDDEYGTAIPLSEVGQFAGRQMWFPPYNIEINEVATAKFESTVMVGRNEPMYNYQNSERSATLTFSLLVDYPEHLRNVEYQGQNKNKEIADFFAFGGNPLPAESQIDVIEEKIEKLIKQREELTGPVDKSEPPALTASAPDVTIYFPNDLPKEGQENYIISSMYNNPLHYEILSSIESAQDGNGFGLNKKIYYLEKLVGEEIDGRIIYTGVSGTSDQYNQDGVSTQYGQCELNKNLLDVFGDEETRKYYKIKITGTASKLYLTDNEKTYNDALGNRRTEAAKQLIIGRLTAMFGANVANEIADTNIETVLGVGSSEGSAEGAESTNMHNENVKKERSATISFLRNNAPVEDKTQDLNQQQTLDTESIDKDILALEVEKNKLKLNIQENIFNERNKAILNGFEAVSGNQFYPTFHSQTPEDLHRRLTFLQQCTRQGAAKRYDIVDSNTGELRARNSVFGKQPICVLRLGDFLHTKIIIETVTIDYADAPWDMNPEGFGMQPMMANVTLVMKVIGGQSLKGPVDALQNAVSFNYYANSTFTNKGMYARPAAEATEQNRYIHGVDNGVDKYGNYKTGIVGEKQQAMSTAYNKFREGEE